ncbi:unnamed protein product [Linum tenue]|uniref:Uncharacterized protein n=1 Tax=Linum tenue TaxID=586396 RepID=A0AAV0KU63_9ROSI|nr:unnamed protein product [Linum tenue]
MLFLQMILEFRLMTLVPWKMLRKH